MKRIKKITGILIDPYKNTIEKCELEQPTNPRERLQKLYDMLECELVEMPTRFIRGKKFTIVCDEEFLYRQNNSKVYPSVITFDMESEMIVEQFLGKVFICKHNDEGEMISLSKKEIKHILKIGCTMKHPQMDYEGKVIIAHI
jgi:hypothetical protein